MNKKIEEAMKLHDMGFNCAQAVAIPFCEELGVDRKTAMMAMEGFGAGMGGRTQTCGALSGVIFLAGLKNSDGNLEVPTSKKNTYAICADLCKKFEAECGSTVCQEIKSLNKRSCNECIGDGIALAEELLK
ncbi:MAG: C_GCAxxG_C_C family protein [Clostridia bacterium]|nr:C_GCAxxG_C_C family protein [Clostridia bacterium]